MVPVTVLVKKARANRTKFDNDIAMIQLDASWVNEFGIYYVDIHTCCVMLFTVVSSK